MVGYLLFVEFCVVLLQWIVVLILENFLVVYVFQNVVFLLDCDFDFFFFYVDFEMWLVIEDEFVWVFSRVYFGNIFGCYWVCIVVGWCVLFGIYFNVFFVFYWQYWMSVCVVQFIVCMMGLVMILVYCLNGFGVCQCVVMCEVIGEVMMFFDFDFIQYSDGGWIWFDIVVDEKFVVFEGVEWIIEQELVCFGKVLLGIMIYNKLDYCVEIL